MPNQKKSFKDPTALFISEPAAAATQDPAGAVIPDGYRLVPEAKSKRMQLLVRPTVYEKFRVICDGEGISVNEKINQLLEAAVKGAGDL